MTDPEIAALVEQAARNLETLELLARASQLQDRERIQELRERLHTLQLEYIRETDALTQQVLLHEMERRTSIDRRSRDAANAQAHRARSGAAESV